MLDAIAMWRHTKMVVLVALSGAAYVAVTIPFAFFVVIPGYSEFRPGAGIPVVCGWLFGPAGAWGAAFGNVVGDVLTGKIGLGSIFGFGGNFLLAYVPYRMWRVLRGDQPATGERGDLRPLIACAIAGAFCCATVIGFGVGGMGLVPYPLLVGTIAINNGFFGTIVALLLLPALYSRARAFGLLYPDLLDASEYTSGRIGWLGMALTWSGGALGILAAVFVFAAAFLQGVGLPERTDWLDPQVLVGGIGTLVLLIGTVLMSPLSARVPPEEIAPPLGREEA